MQTDSMHSFHAAHGIMIAAPDCFGTVRVFLHVKIYRQKSCWSMVLWPIEFDAAGNPRASEANQCWFDNQLIVNQIVAVALILKHMNAPANFRQHHHANELV